MTLCVARVASAAQANKKRQGRKDTMSKFRKGRLLLFDKGRKEKLLSRYEKYLDKHGLDDNCDKLLSKFADNINCGWQPTDAELREALSYLIKSYDNWKLAEKNVGENVESERLMESMLSCRHTFTVVYLSMNIFEHKLLKSIFKERMRQIDRYKSLQITHDDLAVYYLTEEVSDKITPMIEETIAKWRKLYKNPVLLNYEAQEYDENSSAVKSLPIYDFILKEANRRWRRIVTIIQPPI